jgi:superfamily I DNA and/or RNA helicase
MAGDPCQLGPVILSRLAKKHGMDVSAMERLIQVEPYLFYVSL